MENCIVGYNFPDERNDVTDVTEHLYKPTQNKFEFVNTKNRMVLQNKEHKYLFGKE